MPTLSKSRRAKLRKSQASLKKSSIDELNWVSLTAAINKIKSPNRFVRDLLFSNEKTYPTEKLELSQWLGGREMAPFVKKNGSAIAVGGVQYQFATVEGPNIRIKRPMTPSQYLWGRKPGYSIYGGAADIRGATADHIARDLARMEDMIVNTEEWMCCQALTGSLAYQVNDRENYTIDFQRPSANNITLSTFWDAGSLTTSFPEEDVDAVKSLVQEAISINVTDAICGVTAAKYFRRHPQVRDIIKQLSNITAGSLTYSTFPDANGVTFLGEVFGIRWWRYNRQVLKDGVLVDMIRPKYVEFVSRNPEADFELMYAAIAEEKVLEGELLETKRFSKSWIEEDPPVRNYLVHSRPLPIPHKPESTVSMKVIT